MRPLALQASAAERSAKLAEEVNRLQASIASLDLTVLGERRAEAERRRTTALAARQELERSLEALLTARAAAEEELTDAAGEREGATATLYRLRSAGERLALRREAAKGLAGARAWAAATAARPRRSDGEPDPAHPPAPDRAQYLAEREGLPPRACARRAGRQLVLGVLGVPRRERARSCDGTRPRGGALLAGDPLAPLHSVERAPRSRARLAGRRRRPRPARSSSCRSSRSSSCSHRRPLR